MSRLVKPEAFYERADSFGDFTMNEDGIVVVTIPEVLEASSE